MYCDQYNIWNHLHLMKIKCVNTVRKIICNYHNSWDVRRSQNRVHKPSLKHTLFVFSHSKALAIE